MPTKSNTLILVAALAGCGGYDGAAALDEEIDEPIDEQSLALHAGSSAKRARGAFSCDFAIPAGVPPQAIPGQIERDRMYMAAQPGFIRKHIPLSFDPATGNLFAGGRYLFEKRKDASDYHRFVARDFVLDGVQFLSRPAFIAPECHDWSVVGAEDFGDIHSTHVVMRTERFAMSGRDPVGALTCRWPDVRHEAERRGYTSVSMLYNRDEGLASLVYYADRVGPADPTSPDFASLGALAGAPPLGEKLDDLGWQRTFDRTQWVLTVWFPFRKGDTGEPSVWPSSPPLPAPFCTDGVCEVSRGESGATCPSDCPATCGDGACQAGEDTKSCPGDCRI
jgi:hypothetical protein